MTTVPTTTAQRSTSRTNAQRRRWASGRELDRIEQLACAYRAQLPPTKVLRILPVAVDANVLLNPVARVASGWGSDLLATARLGVVRVYVGESVPAEIEEHPADRARVARASVDDLARVWRAEAQPWLRVVDTGAFEHPSLAPIAARDLEDRPTAVLSLFVGAAHLVQRR